MPADSLGSPGLSTGAAAPALPSATQGTVLRSTAFAATAAGVESLRHEALIPEWNQLCRRSAAAPFLRPQWLCKWWQAFGETGDELILWQLRRADRLVALLPLVQRGDQLLPARNYHTPHAGLLADDSASAEALLCAVLRSTDTRQTTLAALDTASSDPEICRRAARASGHSVLTLPHERACHLTLDGGWYRRLTRRGRSAQEQPVHATY